MTNTNPLHILLIDDNPDDRFLIIRTLNREFFDLRVTEVTTQTEYEHALTHERFDLIITDYQLCWNDGLSILRAAKARLPDCPVIMFTGTGSEEIAVEAMKIGLDDYVLKSPKHYGRLPARVRLALEQAAQQQQLVRVERALRKSDAFLRAIIDAEPECVKIIGADGRLQFMNNAGLALVEAESAEEILGTDLSDLLLPEYRQAYTALTGQVLLGGRGTLEFEITSLKGTQRWMGTHVVPLETEDGMVILGVTRDISTRKSAEEARVKFAALIEATTDCICIADMSGRVSHLNSGGKKLLDIPQEEDVSAARMDDYYTPDAMEALRIQALPAALLDGTWSGESMLHSRSGENIPVSQVVIVHRTANGKPAFISAIARDLTESRRHEAQLQHMANHNALTGLPNRNLLVDRLQQSLIDAKRHDRMVALIYLNLDRFKHISESLGHELGDLALKMIAQQLTNLLGTGDTVAHPVGDEFALLCNDISHSEDASGLVKKIVTHFEHTPITVGGHKLYVTVSAGIALYPADSETPDGILKAALTAMTRSKTLGGNTFQFYASQMNARALENLALASELHDAIAQDQLELHYQPQVDLVSGQIVGMEALARWRHPLRGMVSPGVFIPLAEEIGLIGSIGAWVLHEACRQNKAWQKQGLPPLRVAVNLSARQFLQADIVEVVVKTLTDTGLASRYLELEITESMLMQDINETISTMQKLNACGINFSLDDFGTGYSSLSHLKRFPLETLKIDQSFVRDIPQDKDDTAIATAIIAMARALDISVVAEGVETAEQLAFLRTQHCDAIQGYFFSRPLPAEDFARLLREGKTL